MRLANGWTGGQYSLVRALLGLYLAVHFAHLLPWAAELFSTAGVLPDGAHSPLFRAFPNVLLLADGPAVATGLTALGLAAAAALAVGWRDRIAALVAWYVLACLFGRNPLIANPSLPYVGWLLLAHAILPRAPYGSLAARGRVDPGGGWRFPPTLFAAAWIVMAVGYTYSGAMKLTSPSWIDGSAMQRVLENPLARPTVLVDALASLPSPLLIAATWGALALEVLYAPLACVRRLRPWIWLAMVGMHVGLIALIDFADLSLGMLLLHLFTFDPAWVPRPAREGSELVLYDGSCGVCHGWVRFLLAEDPDSPVRFASLDGETARERLADVRDLPDSIVVLGAGDTPLVRSRAALHLLAGLGGLWRVLALALRVVPRSLADRIYDGVAAVRHRLVSPPPDACPIVAPHLRTRFLP